MRLNVATKPTVFTHEGAPAKTITPEQALRRSVLSCFLWESEFYEDGQEIAKRILDLCAQVKPEIIASLAVEARHQLHLRHVPLLLLCGLVKHGKGAMVSDAIARTIGRADELSELLAVYWREGKRPLSAQLKRGLAKAFLKFDEYALAKYNRDNAVKLRDVLFLSHAKADTPEREALWKRLINGELQTPDTWEVALSTGADKREELQHVDAGFWIAEKPSKLRAMKNQRDRRYAERWEHCKASLRAKVEHPFRVIKRQFGYVKVRYRGLAKNTAQVQILFALSNLWMARRQLLPATGSVRL